MPADGCRKQKPPGYLCLLFIANYTDEKSGMLKGTRANYGQTTPCLLADYIATFPSLMVFRRHQYLIEWRIVRSLPSFPVCTVFHFLSTEFRVQYPTH